jgi:hypothetical protein
MSIERQMGRIQSDVVFDEVGEAAVGRPHERAHTPPKKPMVD